MQVVNIHTRTKKEGQLVVSSALQLVLDLLRSTLRLALRLLGLPLGLALELACLSASLVF